MIARANRGRSGSSTSQIFSRSSRMCTNESVRGSLARPSSRLPQPCRGEPGRGNASAKAITA